MVETAVLDGLPRVMGEKLIAKFDFLLERGTDSLMRDLLNLTTAKNGASAQVWPFFFR